MPTQTWCNSGEQLGFKPTAVPTEPRIILIWNDAAEAPTELDTILTTLWDTDRTVLVGCREGRYDEFLPASFSEYVENIHQDWNASLPGLRQQHGAYVGDQPVPGSVLDTVMADA